MDRKPSKNKIWIPVIAAVAVAGIILVLLCTWKPQEVKYTEFLELVKEGRVEKVVRSVDGLTLTYDLKGEKSPHPFKQKYQTTDPETDAFKETLLLNDIKVEKAFDTVSLLMSLVNVVYIFLIVALILSITSSTKGGSKFEVLSGVKLRFKDVAGMKELKEELLTIADMMKDKRYIEQGARFPKGILLSGPPGNGKTFIAKAFAGETGVNFIAVNAADFGSAYVSVGSSKIKKLFKTARENAPCVVFIDEIDGLASKRSNNTDSASKEMNTMITALLTQMDGFSNSDGVLVFAATNRLSDIDRAVLRPGRFDRQFHIGNPDKDERKALFGLYLEGKKMDGSVNIDRLASLTFNCPSSAIESVVNEALIKAIRNNRDMTMEDFEEAILETQVKGFTKKETADDVYKERVAYHEAGHAVAGSLLCHDVVTKVSILPTTSGVGGFTLTEVNDKKLMTLAEIKNSIIKLYAGRAAEYVLYNQNEMQISTGASNDITRATALIMDYLSTKKGLDMEEFGYEVRDSFIKEAEKIKDEIWEETVTFVRRHYFQITNVALLLMENEVISGEEFEEHMEDLPVFTHPERYKRTNEESPEYNMDSE